MSFKRHLMYGDIINEKKDKMGIQINVRVFPFCEVFLLINKGFHMLTVYLQ